MKKTFSNQIKACCCAVILFFLFNAMIGSGGDESVPASADADDSSAVTSAVVTTTGKAEPTDTVPPVAKAADMEAFAGDSVSYKKNIIVSDNEDGSPMITVDSSKVDLKTPGKYPVVYTVTDKAGNKTELRITITVKKKPAVDIKAVEAYNDKRAKEILAEITDSSMNTMQKAFAIYLWAKSSIIYIGESDKSNYKAAAKEGFEKMAGDCYTYYAVSKVLLEKIGVKTYDMVKLRESSDQPRHYWLLIDIGTGWYHFDSTPYRVGYDYFFMVTDSELKAWDKKYRPGCHNYSPDGMPTLATKSVQAKLTYPERLPVPDEEDSSSKADSSKPETGKVTTSKKVTAKASTTKATTSKTDSHESDNSKTDKGEHSDAA